jgi:DNA-binding response OmpR family regulator
MPGAQIMASRSEESARSRRAAPGNPRRVPFRILVVDDEQDTCDLIEAVLTGQGYAVVTTTDGLQVVDLVLRQHFDLVLLDIKLPRVSGLELLREIRALSPSLNVILITGYASVETAVEGLKGGARDYLIKPFNLDELRVAIAKTLHSTGVAPGRQRSTLQHRDLTVDLSARRVWRRGREVRLTRLEFDVLAYLFQAWGRAVPNAELLENVWGYRESPLRSSIVKSCIRRLRGKIEDDASAPEYVQTVWGVGYRLGIEDLGPETPEA